MTGSSRPEIRWAPDTVPAEKVLYQRFAEELPPTVELLPQVMLTVPTRGKPQEVEADLVIIDPDHGVTVVEVKGGTLSYDAARAVWRRRERGSAAIRDPVQQVKKARSVMRTYLKQRHFPIEEIALRWAVATPDCTLDSPGEGLLPTDQLWDARMLADPAGALARVQRQVTQGEQPIGDERAGAIARALRGRDVEGIASTAGDVALHEGRVRALTESHRNVVRRFLADRRVLVRGAAGTGKTMLAVEAAAMFASQGDRVLLTCWHRLLADQIRRLVTARLGELGSPLATQVTADADGRVVVGDLAGLVSSPEESRPPPGTTPAEWYYTHLPERLVTERTGGPFDVVILDEAQDPNELWLLALDGVLREGGRMIAFADRQQNLFGTAPGLTDFVEVEHELTENFRNSRQIADFSALFGAVETDCLTGDGPRVELIRADRDRVVGRVTEVARKLCRDEGYAKGDIAALWLYHNPLQGDAAGLIAQDVGGKTVTTNSAAFKGLERPVVVLGLDVRPERTPEELKRTIYAAATRARSRLVVLGDPQQLREAELYTIAAMFPKDQG